MTQTLFRAAHLVDPHFNPLNKIPQARAETFHEDVRGEWADFVAQVREKQMDRVFIPGDLFNLKRQSLYAPEDVLYTKSLLAQLPCETDTIPGNHDLPYSAYEQINKTAYKLLHEAAGEKMHCLAQRGSVKVRKEWGAGQKMDVHIHGIQYLPLADLRVALVKMNEQMAQATEASRLEGAMAVHILLLHPDAMPHDDLPLHFEVMSYKDLLATVPEATILCLGHIHHSYPVYTGKSERGHTQFISKPFSFARVVKDYFATTAILELQHKPMYADIHIFLDDAGGLQLKIEYCPIKARPFNEIFLEESLNREIEAGKKVSTFIQQLRTNYGSVAAAFTIQTPEDLLNSDQTPVHIREIINRYLERGETSK